jgi:hypothetical protein
MCRKFRPVEYLKRMGFIKGIPVDFPSTRLFLEQEETCRRGEALVTKVFSVELQRCGRESSGG